VVSRDRAGLYAEAACEGVPQAKQVADRFHLLQNFRETIERSLAAMKHRSGGVRSMPVTITRRRPFRHGRIALLTLSR
jgi:transposase